MRFTHVIDVQQKPCCQLYPKKLEVGGGLALHICVCLDALYMSWCLMGKEEKKKTHTHTHIDAKDTKCLCFGYCKASKHIDSCVWILQNRDVVFMEYSTSVGNDLEMSPRGRNKALMAIRQIF